jgi:heme-binding HmuY-like protein
MTRERRSGPIRVWLFRGSVLLLVAVIGVFAWGYFQPKPPGYAPTDPDEGAFITPEWTRYTVDATDREEWVLFDFNEGRLVAGALSDSGWDLAFKRTGLLTNSGVTNPSGGGGAVDLGEVPLVDAAVPDGATFVADRLGGDDEDEPMNPVISGWYNYNFVTHTVHAKGNTFVVRTGESRDAIVRFDSYYCADESPGCITFRYRLVPAGHGKAA